METSLRPLVLLNHVDATYEIDGRSGDSSKLHGGIFVATGRGGFLASLMSAKTLRDIL